MILINEFLPDPEGADASGEWVELLNTADAVASLGGWSIENSAGKKFIFKGEEIGARSFLVVRRSNTKFTLKNQDEVITLFNSEGQQVDQASLMGTAQSGKTYNRIEISGKAHFLPGEPTPQKINKASEAIVTRDAYMDGALLRSSLSNASLGVLMFGTALVFAGILVFILKTDAYLSKLFFGGDKTIRN